MGFFGKKPSLRRNQVRKSIAAERLSQISRLANTSLVNSALLWLLFVVLCTPVLSFELIRQVNYPEVASTTVIVLLISFAAVLYINHYQKRIIENYVRALALVGLFILLLAATKFGILLTGHTWWATGTAVTAAIILAIAYDQRFAIGMSVFYCVFACFAAGTKGDINLFLVMAAGVVTCCFSLREIRTRMKLLEVSTLAAVIVFVIALALDFLAFTPRLANALRDAALHAGATLVVGLLIQSLLPLIERIFRIATSMTLLDYSDANQTLLKRLAMEAPGTFSHSLLIGSIAEAAAEAIERNGLLCRVGAYYHDIGKLNKPDYFVENEIGSMSRHKELSPAMSQLIIVGHVKDGIEMAKEYNLPAVLRQFIETHHGTTLVEYFYNEAKKRYDEQQTQGPSEGKKGIRGSPPPSESEFRYAGPKPKTKESAIVMLADTIEGAVRSLGEATPTRIEAVVHNMAMKRLQDGQFDECDLTLRELSQIEASISKTLAAHYHGRVPYPKPPDVPEGSGAQKEKDYKTVTAEET
ncbi:MAG TPA: HDIG domain-containing protein [Sedimentisphaerales bacterium]|nr:HDIG domain-containing protein [Sedimentisphaerales bacterium]